MSNNNRDINPSVLAEAAEWFALLGAASTSPKDHEQWQAWLAAKPEHRAAWQRVEFFTHKFNSLPAQTSLSALNSPDLQRRQALKTLAVFCAVGLSSWQVWRQGYWQEWTADYRSGVGEIQTFTLADGSLITLDTDSAIDVDFTQNLRRLRLVRGEVYIETAPDTSSVHRPFVVDCAAGRVRAIGTRFSVREQATDCHAAVYQGAINIQPAANPALSQTLKAGQAANFTRQQIAIIKKIEAHQPAWSQGVLLADNLPLSEFVIQLNRYRHGYITCAPDIAHLRIVGAFPLNDQERILAVLQETLPISVSKQTPWWVRIERR
ncbi:MAG: FecR domain-containing protein [Methylococcales bacterium]